MQNFYNADKRSAHISETALFPRRDFWSTKERVRSLFYSSVYGNDKQN